MYEPPGTPPRAATLGVDIMAADCRARTESTAKAAARTLKSPMERPVATGDTGLRARDDRVSFCKGCQVPSRPHSLYLEVRWRS